MANLQMRHVLLPLIAAGLGFAAWGHGLTLFAALLPFLWAAAATRTAAFAVAAAYYLAGSRVIPSAADIFFLAETSWILGIALWLMGAVILAFPWALLHQRTPLRCAFGTLAALCLLSTPPLGLIGWLNPILGAAQIVPGFGFVSLAIGAIVLMAFAAFGAWIRSDRPARHAWVVPAIFAGYVTVSGPLPAPPEPKDWASVTTNLGREPVTVMDHLQRYPSIVRYVREASDDGPRVIVMPELVAGTWMSSATRYFENELGPMLRERDQTLILGASVPEDDGKLTNRLFVYDGHAWDSISARHVVPVSMWKPWANDGFTAQWTAPGVLDVDGTPAAISLCFEDYVIWPHLNAFARQQPPQAIVSVANFWWVHGSGADRIQNEHIEAWARIFGVPLARAANAS